MRQILNLLFATILFFLQSCNKNTTPPVTTYEMTFKKNGINDTLMPYYCAIQPNSTMPSETMFMIVAKSKNDSVHFGITIQVNGNMTTGVYETINGSGSYPVIADYFMNVNHPTERDYSIDNAPGQPNSFFKVTLTSITDKQVKGTFTGNYLYDRFADESIIITEGSFVAKRHN